MSPTLEACLRSWPFDPWLLAALLLTAGVYLRGWLVLRRRDPRRWHGGRPAAFLGGLAAIDLALASPVEPFADLLLQVHMVQHLLLMMAAPPLLWLGAPLFPLLRGLPRPVRIFWVAPWLSAPPLRRIFGRLTHPLTALVLFVAATWVWHAPPVYDLALRSSGWHYLQHACFLGTALVFWYPIVRPYPARPRWSPWLLLPCLFLADLSNTALAALLTFSDRLLYPYYAEVPRLAGLSPLEDQSAAGVVMWVPGSAAFLLPLFTIGVQLLSGRGASVTSQRSEDGGQRSGAGGRGTRPLPGRISLPVLNSPPTSDLRPATSGFDLLRLPLLGRFLKWRHARLCLQVPLLLLAAVTIYDGLRGPQVGRDEPGRRPAVDSLARPAHPRAAGGRQRLLHGLSVPAAADPRPPLPAGRPELAAAGCGTSGWRSSCSSPSCGLTRRWPSGTGRGGPPGSPWVTSPRPSSSTACSAARPSASTSARSASSISCNRWLRRWRSRCGTRPSARRAGRRIASAAATASPAASCTCSCRARRATWTAPPASIASTPARTTTSALIAGLPTAELWNDRQRSGVGRFGRRPDIAALIVVLVFGAFANAAGMVGPVAEGQERLALLVGVRSPLLATTAFYLLALVALPLLAVGGAAALSRRWGRLEAGTLEVATRYAYALMPLGFGMWLAHYCFHFLTSYDTVVPVAQRFAADLGLTWLGMPAWGCALLSPRDGVAAPLGVPISGRGAAPVPLCRLPPGVLAEGPGALGTAPGAAVRGGGMDPPPADADARHSLRDQG